MVARTLCALAVLTGLAATPCVAQQPSPPRPTNPGAAEAPTSVISIDFPGGSVAQYIEALKKASPGKPVNIIASDRAAKQMLSAISLKDVQVAVAAYAIRSAALSQTGDWGIGPMASDPVVPGGSASYRVDFEPSRRSSDAIVVEALSLQRIIRPGLGDKNAEQASKIAMTAIETGLQLQNADRDNAPELKFHSDSGILFVRGLVPDVHLVGQIVARLSDDAERRQAIMDRKGKDEKLIALAVKEAEMEVALRSMELDAAEKSYGIVQNQVTQGVAGQGELTQRALELGRAKVGLERAKIGVERAQLQGAREGGGAAQGADGGPPDIAQLQATIQMLMKQNRDLSDQLSSALAAMKQSQPVSNDAPSRSK